MEQHSVECTYPRNPCVCKLASSEIAQSRARFEKWLYDQGRDYVEMHGGTAYKIWQAAERDTRERLSHPKMMWGWDIEEIKSAMRQFQSKHPGELPSEVERAERIRGKE